MGWSDAETRKKTEDFGDYEDVIRLDEQGLSYEWNELRVMRRKEDGKLYWLSAGGCSCDYFDEYVGLAEPVTRQNQGEIEQAIHDFPAEQEEKFAALKKLRELLD